MSFNKRSNYYFLQAGLLAACVSALGFSGVASAGEDDRGGASNNECPVGLVNNGMTLDDEFGYLTSELTKCLDRRHNVKVVMQINKPCRDSWVNDKNEVKNNVAKCKRSEDPNVKLDFGRSYALGNINNMIKDYEITHGMVVGKDYEIAAIVHSGGGFLLLKDGGDNGKGGTNSNKFEPEVKNLMDRGVKFYFCQNTTRGFIGNGTLPAGNATAQLIEGVEYVTAGVTSIAEFQSRGYRYVQP